MATDVAQMATNEYARRQKEDNSLPDLVFRPEDVVDLLPDGASFKFVDHFSLGFPDWAPPRVPDGVCEPSATLNHSADCCHLKVGCFEWVGCTLG